MIGYLKGVILQKELKGLLVNVHDIGYFVQVPGYVWQEASIGKLQDFFIYTHVREDELSLYGFLNPEDKLIFQQLITVSGIGPKVALKIISNAGSAEKIIKAIQKADVDFFLSIKGIGKKTSQRIIIDLKSKIGGIKELQFEAESDLDLEEALRGLGFSTKEIKQAVKGIKKELSLEEKLKLALKNK